MRKVIVCVCLVGISFSATMGMVSQDTHDQSAVGCLCAPVFDSGMLKTFLNSGTKLNLKKRVNKPIVNAANEIGHAVSLAENFVLPEQIVFLPEANADSLLMTKWKTTPFSLQGKGLQLPVVYKKKIGERILDMLGDKVSMFDQGVVCYFAGDLFKTGKESLFSKYVVPKLDMSQPKVVEKYWCNLYKALIEKNSYKEIQENIAIELKKRGIRI